METQKKTLVLVRNLHCPSCVSNIEESLRSLSPAPDSISTSIVSQTVTICHTGALPRREIMDALVDVGFEIEKVSTGDGDGEDDIMQDEARTSSSYSRECRRNSWASAKLNGKMECQKHIDNCDMCRAEVAASRASLAGVHVESEPQTLVTATLSVSGMTCSSCVTTISECLNAFPWVESASVNLITASTQVVFWGPNHLSAVVEAIENLGYDAEVNSCDSLETASAASTTPAMWRGSFAIEGMTCTSCVVTISEALKKLDWVEDVAVNLVVGSATVEVRDRGRLNEVTGILENLGYGSNLDSIEAAGASHGDEQVARERKVTIHVDGMHCSSCPGRILHMMENTYGDRVHLDEPIALNEPYLKISYTPHAPDFTVRHILQSISELDNSFTVSIFHPPTLEERSRQIHRHHKNLILRRLILAFTAAIPNFVIGVVYMNLISKDNAGRRYLMEPMWSGTAKRVDWTLFFISTPVYFLAADFFHRRALIGLWSIWQPGSRTPFSRRFYRFGTMDLLVSLGVTVAYFASIGVLAVDASQPAPQDGEGAEESEASYFDAVVFLTMFLLAGRLIEAYSKAVAGDALSMLGKLRPTSAILIGEPGGVATVPVDRLEFGDVVRIAHGSSPPFDGVVTEGTSQFDESSLTGESSMVPKHVGDEVFSGTINKGAPIAIRITRASGNSMLDQVIAAVREGQSRRAPMERFADILTGYFVPAVTYLTVIVWLVWLTLGLSGSLPEAYLDVDVGGWPFWSLKFAVAVFVIACPCGIGLAAPTALFVGGGLAAKHGILVKGGGEAFQEASQLDCIVFDKTGTLTQGGEPAIAEHKIFFSENQADIIGAVKKLEESSSHPLARATANFCANDIAGEVITTHIEEVSGKGMKGSFTSGGPAARFFDIIVGNEALMTSHGIVIKEENEKPLDVWKGRGESVVLIGVKWQAPEESEWKLWAMLAASDPLRPEAKRVVAAFQELHIQTWMISGDNPRTAGAVAEKVGIPAQNVIAGVLPEQKAERVKYLQGSLHKMRRGGLFGMGKPEEDLTKRAVIAMVGDGINDSPALTRADVGIAIGSGSDIAISSAEFVLVSSDLTALLTLVDLSRMVFRRVKFNFGWALVYNVIAVPVAAGVLYPLVDREGNHIRLEPVWASLAMALSSISVVCSSLAMRTRLPWIGFKKRT